MIDQKSTVLLLEQTISVLEVENKATHIKKFQCYTRERLYNIRRLAGSKKLSTATLKVLSEFGLLRYRGCRGRRHKIQDISVVHDTASRTVKPTYDKLQQMISVCITRESATGRLSTQSQLTDHKRSMLETVPISNTIHQNCNSKSMNLQPPSSMY